MRQALVDAQGRRFSVALARIGAALTEIEVKA
jgi:hypothetical protein